MERWLRGAGVPEASRLPALLLVLLGGGLGGLLFELTPLPVDRCLDIAVGLLPVPGDPRQPALHGGHGAPPVGAVGLRRRPRPPGRVLGILLGTALGLVRPYDLALLGVVRALGIACTEPPRRWARAGWPLLGLLPVLALRPVALLRQRAVRLVPAGRGLPALGRLPARPRPRRGPGPSRCARAPGAPDPGARAARAHLWAWAAVAGAVIVARPGSFSLQLLVGAGVPLLVLGAAGLARLGPRVTTLLALALSTSAVVATRVVLAEEPNWFVPRERMAAGLALRELCAPGDLVLGPPDVGLYAVGLSRCHALLAHPAAPDYARRLGGGARVLRGVGAARARAWLDRRGVTHLVLPGDAGPVPVGWLGAGTPFRLAARVGAGPSRPRDLRAASPRARLRCYRSALMSAPAPAPIAFHAPWFDERELEAVREALAGRVAGDGPLGRRVEALLAERMGATRVLLTTSGTHALELALLALGIGPGQEVVCPSFTFVSSANAVLRAGARPVFAEIEETHPRPRRRRTSSGA